MSTLSKINPCITPDMEKFLNVVSEIAKDYRIADLNEYLGIYEGKFKISIAKVREILEAKLGIVNLNITQRENGNYDITGFVGEVKENKRGKGKEFYISNMKEA